MDLKNLKIIFFGTPYFAREILENLLKNNIPVLAVITQPDRPVGRKQIPKPSEVKELALKYDIDIFQFEKINDDTTSKIKSLHPDLIIVASYSLLLPEKLLSIPKFGCVNVHPSLLPKLRGATPIQTALLLGMKETGITIMLMDKGMDSGNILSQKEISIDNSDKYPELEKKTISAANEILIPTIEKLVIGEINPIPQNESAASYTKITRKEDGVIDWSKPAKNIFNQFRAFYNWPKIYSFLQTKNGFRKKISFGIIEFNNEIKTDEIPGTVFLYENQVAIQTGKGIIFPKKIQLEGKSMMDIQTFTNGRPEFIGSKLI